MLFLKNIEKRHLFLTYKFELASWIGFDVLRCSVFVSKLSDLPLANARIYLKMLTYSQKKISDSTKLNCSSLNRFMLECLRFVLSYFKIDVII